VILTKGILSVVDGVDGRGRARKSVRLSMLSALKFKRAQKHAKILGTKVGDAFERDEHQQF
jgi:hypothetical protein